MKDFYYILGTEPNASSIEIREAYKKLSKKFHPDLNENDYYFESHFREIAEAYNTLNDPHKKREYDALLKKSATITAAPKPQKRLPLPKRTYIDITFTIILISITSIFGYYVYNALYPTKKVKAKLVADVITPVPVQHHKKKHKTKANQVTETSYLAKADAKPARTDEGTQKTKAIQSAPVISKVVAVKPAAPIIKTVALQSNVIPSVSNVAQPSNLYTAYIRANATGVVYLRKFDNYSSDVVSNIPNNTKVTVLEQGKIFCKVSFNNETGYVPKWTLLMK